MNSEAPSSTNRKGSYPAGPDFLIIGAQKAGTTALHNMLTQHPNLAGARLKGVHYFDGAQLSYGDLHGYLDHFARSKEGIRQFEATPSYLYHPKCARRIFKFNPHMRLIVILRNPVERAFSAWNFYRQFQSKSHPNHHLAEFRSFEKALEDEMIVIDSTCWATNKIAYVRRGLYAEQLMRYFDYFPRSQIKILEYRKLKGEMKVTLKETCHFLGVREDFEFHSVEANVGKYESKIDNSTREMLSGFYRPHNEALENLIGVRFDWK